MMIVYLHLSKLGTNDQDFDHWIMEHVKRHGILAQKLTQPGVAQSGEEGLPLILGEAQQHNQLQVTEEQLGVDIDVGKLQ